MYVFFVVESFLTMHKCVRIVKCKESHRLPINCHSTLINKTLNWNLWDELHIAHGLICLSLLVHGSVCEFVLLCSPLGALPQHLSLWMHPHGHTRQIRNIPRQQIACAGRCSIDSTRLKDMHVGLPSWISQLAIGSVGMLPWEPSWIIGRLVVGLLFTQAPSSRVTTRLRFCWNR